jgi:hypothetical protein
MLTAQDDEDDEEFDDEDDEPFDDEEEDYDSDEEFEGEEPERNKALLKQFYEVSLVSLSPPPLCFCFLP